RVSFLVGLSRGRSPDEVLKPLAGIATTMYAVPVPAGGSVDPADLTSWAESCGIICREYDSPEAGLDAAMAERREGEPLVVCGSLFLIAVVREILASLPSETVSLK
ncbi:MAG: hypothetical protein KAT93_08730, partial [Desulfuromonadales bacterium]|nr:hypothetical protein [Desulfuromonadales bacterium]